MIEELQKALANGRFETARRLAMASLAGEGEKKNTLTLLHQAEVELGDFAAAAATLGRLEALAEPGSEFEQEIVRMRAEDYQAYATDGHYRTSREKAEGFTVDEFLEKYQRLADECRVRLKTRLTPVKVVASGSGKELIGNSKKQRVRLRLLFPDGSPAAGVGVSVGVCPDPAVDAEPIPSYAGLGLPPRAFEVGSWQNVADDQGSCVFANIPSDRLAFVAVHLDPEKEEIATRFVAHEVMIPREGAVELTIGEWTSAPAEEPPPAVPAQLVEDGMVWSLRDSLLMRNPFSYEFPGQLIEWESPKVADVGDRSALLLRDSMGRILPFQRTDRGGVFWCDLPAGESKSVGLYAKASDLVGSVEKEGSGTSRGGLRLVVGSDGTAVLETGSAAFHLGWEKPGATPLIAVRGPDEVWRGSGRWVLPEGNKLISQAAEILEMGALRVRARMDFRFAGGGVCKWEIEAHAGDPCLLVREAWERSDGIGFEFLLNEFLGGRGYLHWTPERNRSRHWHSLGARDSEFARLQESVPWWIAPSGFGCAVTMDGLDSRDYIGLFTLRRGEWVDREFARIAQGPGDEPGWRRELDWPYPEMVGSTISMITAETRACGEVSFCFRSFDGERQWGIMASDFAANDGPLKEISALQHKNSSPRLTDFIRWRLDEPDQEQRPHVLVRRRDLPTRRTQVQRPEFAKALIDLQNPETAARSACAGMRLHLLGDAASAWAAKLDLLRNARFRPRLCLLGRDAGDIYSPVGGRPVTHHAEDFDLLAPTGIFTPEEERSVRRYLMLMGHLFMETDLMNWRFNSRNANFEADRVDIVGTIGVTFRGNPDAEIFIEHARELMRRSVEIYCTPKSGKWYENPACYYLHAAKCRLNVAFHLATHERFNPCSVPRLKEFLEWAIILLTPPTPLSYEVFREGPWPSKGSENLVRRVPPIGDHAVLGKYILEHFALLAGFYRPSDPKFADRLLWAFRATGGRAGFFGAPALFLGRMPCEEAVRQVVTPVLGSRRLEGFGAVFRGNFDQPDEFYLLIKQGPGGYRYHRTEGSFILFAQGRPLVYDGGEGGETWRHSTLSFFHSHQPMAAGHVERFASLPTADFCQGVHPTVIAPGEPVFLSDNCHHDLVPVAFERYRHPDPAVVRSFVWVKDDYVIVHDDLRVPEAIPRFWHLQVVANREEKIGPDAWRFRGRFGIDLQVTVAGASERNAKVEHLPFHEYSSPMESRFAMRHLQISEPRAACFSALLRPLESDSQETLNLVQKSPGHLQVAGAGIEDDHFFSRVVREFSLPEGQIVARYASVLRRKNCIVALLPDGGEFRLFGKAVFYPEGVAVEIKYEIA